MVKIDNKTRAEIIKLRAVGYTNQEIGEMLDIPPSTVSYQIQKMKREAQDKGVDEALGYVLLGAAVGAGAVGLGIILAKLLEK